MLQTLLFIGLLGAAPPYADCVGAGSSCRWQLGGKALLSADGSLAPDVLPKLQQSSLAFQRRTRADWQQLSQLLQSLRKAGIDHVYFGPERRKVALSASAEFDGPVYWLEKGDSGTFVLDGAAAQAPLSTLCGEGTPLNALLSAQSQLGVLVSDEYLGDVTKTLDRLLGACDKTGRLRLVLPAGPDQLAGPLSAFVAKLAGQNVDGKKLKGLEHSGRLTQAVGASRTLVAAKLDQPAWLSFDAPICRDGRQLVYQAVGSSGSNAGFMARDKADSLAWQQVGRVSGMLRERTEGDKLLLDGTLKEISLVDHWQHPVSGEYFALARYPAPASAAAKDVPACPGGQRTVVDAVWHYLDGQGQLGKKRPAWVRSGLYTADGVHSIVEKAAESRYLKPAEQRVLIQKAVLTLAAQLAEAMAIELKSAKDQTDMDCWVKTDWAALPARMSDTGSSGLWWDDASNVTYVRAALSDDQLRTMLADSCTRSQIERLWQTVASFAERRQTTVISNSCVPDFSKQPRWVRMGSHVVVKGGHKRYLAVGRAVGEKPFTKDMAVNRARGELAKLQQGVKVTIELKPNASTRRSSARSMLRGVQVTDHYFDSCENAWYALAEYQP